MIKKLIVVFVAAFVILTVVVAVNHRAAGNAKATDISSRATQQGAESRHTAAALPLAVVP